MLDVSQALEHYMQGRTGGNSQFTDYKDEFLYSIDGATVHPFRIHDDEIIFEHIGRALSNNCRYGGRVTKFYSVAQHSVIGSCIAEDTFGREAARQFLFHDAGEFVFPDEAYPIKRWFPEIGAREALVTPRIFAKLNMDPDGWVSPEVKHIDGVMYKTEMRDVLPFNVMKHDDYPGCEASEDYVIDCCGPQMAYNAFARRFVELFPEWNGQCLWLTDD